MIRRRLVRRWARCLDTRLFLAIFALGSLGVCQQQTTRPTVSKQPLTAEDLAIYAAVIHGWVDDGKHPVHIAMLTEPLHVEDSAGCSKTPLGKADSNVVHRFRKEDLAQLGSSMIELVDPDAQSLEIEKNDPGRAIRNGASVDDAVRNGFAHGMVTLSEIRFDMKHEHAIVWYGFRCGGLCGNGGTVLMEKKDGKWRRGKSCGVWMSERRITSVLPVAMDS